LIALLFGVRTQSSAQILVFEGDTLSCYTDYELGVITKASEKVIILDSLLKEERLQTTYLKTQVGEYEDIRLNDAQIIRGKEVMVADRDMVIEEKKKEIISLNKEVKKQKVWKVIGTGFFAITTIVALIL